VRALAQVDRADPLSNDLIDLLRTPLLLDVFLRTFKRGEPELRARGFSILVRSEASSSGVRFAAMISASQATASGGVIDALFRALPAAELAILQADDRPRSGRGWRRLDEVS
jgi:hypothetical protein